MYKELLEKAAFERGRAKRRVRKHAKKHARKHVKKVAKKRRVGKLGKYRAWGKQAASRYGKRFKAGHGVVYSHSKPRVKKLKKIDLKKVPKAAKKTVGARNLKEGYKVLMNKKGRSMRRKHRKNDPGRRHHRVTRHRRNPPMMALLSTKNILWAAKGFVGLTAGMYTVSILKKLPVVGGMIEKVDGMTFGYLNPILALVAGFALNKKLSANNKIFGNAIMLGGAVSLVQKTLKLPALAFLGLGEGEVELQGIEEIGGIEQLSGLEGIEENMGALVPEGLADVGEEMYQ
jgi:hypothetical protein